MRTVASPKMRSRYDLVVIGGGILGLCVANEATRQGYTALVVERDKICGAASGNSLRIVHGGFRYLQKCAIRRFQESQVEQQWFLSEFPDYVKPLPCVLPLDGRRYRRKLVAKVAAQLAAKVTARGRVQALPNACLLSRDDVAERFGCRVKSRWSLVWHDAYLQDPNAVANELASRIRTQSGDVVEGVVCEHLAADGAHSKTILMRDVDSGESYRIECPHVVVCCGAENHQFAADIGIKSEKVPAVTAFNIVFDTLPAVACAVAIPTWHQTYFAVPRGDELVVGTGYTGNAMPTETDIGTVIGHLQDASAQLQPGWRLTECSVSKVESAKIAARKSALLRPAETAGIQLARCGEANVRDSIIVATTPKYTVARRVAQRIMHRIGCESAASEQLVT